MSQIVIAQLNSSITNQFGQILVEDGFEVVLAEGLDSSWKSSKNGASPDLVLIDNTLINPDPVQFCKEVKSDMSREYFPVLLLETSAPGANYSQALDAGFDDILTFPILPSTLLARVRSFVGLRTVMNGQKEAENVLYTLARTIEAKDKYTMGHADRVANSAVLLGKAMGVNGYELETLRKGGMLHDVGKIAIPDAILTKPGKYKPEEFDIMKRHPVLGCDLCEKISSLKEAIPLIRHHHEKLDGSGYPDKLAGNQIPLLVRIVTVVDIYDALRSKRSYKDAFNLDKSLQILWDESEKGWWDKEVIRAWEKVVRDSHI